MRMEWAFEKKADFHTFNRRERQKINSDAHGLCVGKMIG